MLFKKKEVVLRKIWEQKVEMDGKHLYFDNDYASDIMEKRNAYGPIKVLKQKSVRFQTPYTKIKIFWDSGMWTYENADEAALDMIKRGFNLTWVTKENNLKVAKERLDALLPWKRINNTGAGQRTREKLT